MQAPTQTCAPAKRSASPTHPAGPRERVVSWVVLAGLVAIAAGVWRAQQRPNPALLLPVAAPGAASPGAAGWLAEVPAAFVALDAAEPFDAESLSDKINGKAELYLSAGFTALTTRRFAGRAQAEHWFEAYVYEMDSPRAAYAVYSAQRRPGARALAGDAEGYVAGNGVFGLRGRHYVEVIAADTAGVSDAEAFAAALLGRLPSEGAALNERELFPPDRVDADSLGLIAENGFGFAQFDQVMTAPLRTDAGQVTAFVSLRPDPAAARVLADAYVQFLLANGGTSRAAPPEFSEAAAVDVFGMLEIVFAHGRVVAGIHEAEDAAAGWEAVQALRARLREVAAP